MAYLNWKNNQIRIEPKLNNDGMSFLSISLNTNTFNELTQELRNLFKSEDKMPNHELKIELDHGWTLFFRQKLGQSRLTIAHPQEKEWVASLYLNLQDAHKIFEHHGREQIQLSKLFKCAVLSNFDLIIDVSL